MTRESNLKVAFMIGDIFDLVLEDPINWKSSTARRIYVLMFPVAWVLHNIMRLAVLSIMVVIAILAYIVVHAWSIWLGEDVYGVKRGNTNKR